MPMNKKRKKDAANKNSFSRLGPFKPMADIPKEGVGFSASPPLYGHTPHSARGLHFEDNLINFQST